MEIHLKRVIIYQAIKSNLLVSLFFFFLSLLQVGSVYAQNAVKYKVIGKLRAVDGSIVKLSYMDSKGKLIQDSVSMKRGKFSFDGKISGTVAAILHYSTPNTSSAYSTLYLESGKIKVASTPEEDKGILSVSGTKTNNEYRVYRQEIKKVNVGSESLDNAYDSLNNQYIKDKKAGKSEEELQPLVNKLEDIRKKFEPFQRKIREVSINFFVDYPQSYVTADNLKFYVGRLSLDSLSMFYDRLGEPLQKSIAGEYLADEIGKLKAGSPGSTAFVFNATDIEGKPLSLADFRGQYVLLDFWASWCIPCREGNPHLKMLYNKYKSKGFEIIGISDDDSEPDKWKLAVNKDGIAIWKHVLRGFKILPNHEYDSKNDISDSYGIHTLPTKVLIDKEGKIIGRYGSDEEALDMKLAEIFGSI